MPTASAKVGATHVLLNYCPSMLGQSSSGETLRASAKRNTVLFCGRQVRWSIIEIAGCPIPSLAASCSWVTSLFFIRSRSRSAKEASSRSICSRTTFDSGLICFAISSASSRSSPGSPFSSEFGKRISASSARVARRSPSSSSPELSCLKRLTASARSSGSHSSSARTIGEAACSADAFSIASPELVINVWVFSDIIHPNIQDPRIDCNPCRVKRTKLHPVRTIQVPLHRVANRTIASSN